MKPNRNEIFAAMLAALLLLWTSSAAAGPDDRSRSADAAQPHIDGAAQALEQAASQASVATAARQVALLRQAQDDLRAAQRQLDGRRRAQVAALLDDVQEAIEAADSQLGTLSAPDADAFGPLVPDREQLAELATEAQQVQRHESNVRRLIGTVIIGTAPPAAQPPVPVRLAMVIRAADEQALYWPYVAGMAWPQIRIHF